MPKEILTAKKIYDRSFVVLINPMPEIKKMIPNMAYTIVALMFLPDALLVFTNCQANKMSPTMPNTVRITPNAFFSIMVFATSYKQYAAVL
jgi:hypothetical protein